MATVPEPGAGAGAAAAMGAKALGFTVAGALASAAVLAIVPPTRIEYGDDGRVLKGRDGKPLRVFSPTRALAMLLVTVLGSVFGGELVIAWMGLHGAPLSTQIAIAFATGVPAWGILGIVVHSLERRQHQDALDVAREVRDVIRGGNGGGQ